MTTQTRSVLEHQDIIDFSKLQGNLSAYTSSYPSEVSEILIDFTHAVGIVEGHCEKGMIQVIFRSTVSHLHCGKVLETKTAWFKELDIRKLAR